MGACQAHNKKKIESKINQSKIAQSEIVFFNSCIRELESNKGEKRYDARNKVYEEIRARISSHGAAEWETYSKTKHETSDSHKRLERMIGQAQTEERIKNFAKISPRVITENLNESRTPFSSTTFCKYTGNIFNKKDIWGSVDKAIVIPGSQWPLKVYKSATDCLETNLTRVSSFLKSLEPDSEFAFNQCYSYENLTIVRMENENEQGKMLKEGETGTIHVLFCVSPPEDVKNSIEGKGKQRPKDLEGLLQNIFLTAKELRIKELYLPPIGCGVKGCDRGEVSEIYQKSLEQYNGWVEKVILFDKQEEQLESFMNIIGLTLRRNASSIRPTFANSQGGSLQESHYNMEFLDKIPIYKSLNLTQPNN